MLLRQGRTADNAAGRIQGWLDTPLDAAGVAQAGAAASVVPRPSALLTSDLVRASDTAAAVGTVLVWALSRIRDFESYTWVPGRG